MEINHGLGSILSLVKIDTTVAPPLGLPNVLTIIGTGGLVLPQGDTSAQPATHVAGTLRFNTDTSLLEFDNGTTWTSLQQQTTVVTGTGLTVSVDGTTFGTSKLLSGNGTFTLALSTELRALSGLSGTGFLVRTGTGQYAEVSLTSANGTLAIANGNGSGTPTIDLATVGTAVTSSFLKFTTDAYGRVTATTAVTSTDITTALGYTPLNKAGDTLLGALTLSADPTTNLQAATKQYVDKMVSGGATWRNPVVDPNLIDVVATEPTSPISETSYIVSAAGTWTGNFVVAVNDIVAWNQGGTAWVKVATLTAGQRFIIAAEYGSIGTVLSTAGFAKGDLIQYVSGSPASVGSWSEPEGRSGLAGTGTEIAQGTTVLVSADNSPHFGHSYLYDAIANAWIEIAGPGTISLGTGLSYVGNTVSLDTVSVAKGGTGLTSTGTANQILGTNAAGTALEYKTVTAGTGITVTNAAGVLTIASAGGSVTSVAASTTSTGLSISGSPITTNGTLTFTLNAELQGLAGLGANGLVARTAAGTYTEVAVTGTSGNIVVTNGNGVAGAPTVDLATVGTAVTSSFAKFTTDAYGRVTATSVVAASDIRALTPYTAGTGLSLSVGGVLSLNTVAVANGGTGLTSAGAAGTVLGVKADGTLGYKSVGVTGSGITATVTDGNITLANTGVTSAVAGTGISVSGATGAVTISNSGVLSVSGSTGLTATTTTGAVALSLNSELQALSTLGATGLVARTAAGTYTEVAVTGTSGNIVVTNGDGVAGAPTVNLVAVGTAVTSSFAKITTDAYGRVSATTPVVASDILGLTPYTNGAGLSLSGGTFSLSTVGTAVTSSFAKVTTDAYGRVSATTPVVASDITTLVDATYVNVSGDTMATNANLTFAGGEVLGLPATPSADSAAASKAYVDSVAAGLDPKQSVQAATTANITGYSASAGTAGTGGFTSAPTTVDGVTLSTAGQRILVKNQTDAKQNGIYVVVSSGTWQRAADHDGTPVSEVSAGNFVFVEGAGTANATSGWVLTGQGTLTLNTSSLNWVQFSGASTYVSGNGITITGNSIALSAPVTTANGGTGLSTIGSANGFLSVNTAGTGLEYKAITAGTAIGVDTSVAGRLSINNLGVTAVGVGTGLATTASTGSVTLSLNAELTALAGLSATGLVTRTATGTYTEVAIASGNTSNIVITNGNGVAGAPTIDLAPITQGGSGSFVKVSIDTVGRVVGNDAVTAADIRSLTPYSVTSSTGLSLTSGVIAITTVPVANGGTGLTAAGTANQVLGVAAAGGLEYKTVTAGTGISVTNTAGAITVANTGVTSVGLSVPSFLSVASSPVTTTGTLAVTLATQAANTIFAGPTSGSGAAPTFRALSVADLPIKLYSENASSPVANTVSGTNSVAIGSGASATANNAIAMGTGSVARNVGAKVFANGSFATAGDAQSGLYVLRNITTTATATELYLDGSAVQLVIPNNSAVTFQIMVVGRRTDAVGEVAAYRIEGLIAKDETSGSAIIVGLSKTILGESDSAWNASVVADTSTGALKLAVEGEASKTIRWVATVITSEVTN